ncbi:hypothetical protein [Halobacillus salinus]|nr:hypothetical protein [Halobacillus salinus]
MVDEKRDDRRLSTIEMGSEGATGCAGCGLGCLSGLLLFVSIPTAIWMI